MFPKCYLDYMNYGYRPMPPMFKPSIFPGGLAPQAFKPNWTQGSMEESMPGTSTGGETEIISGTTSSGAPTPGAIPKPVPTGVGGPGTVGIAPSHFEKAPGAPVMLDTQYTQGFLRTQIGKKVRVTFLLGTNTLQDRVGVLKSVGISYIIIAETESNTDVLGDIYSIKFVDIFPEAPTAPSGTP
jgi:hypothetical protein